MCKEVVAPRLAGVRSGSSLGYLGLNLNRTFRSGSGKSVNLNLDLGFRSGSGSDNVRPRKKQNFVILQYILQGAFWTRYKQSGGLLDHEPAYSVLRMHLLFETVRLCADARYEVHQCADQRGTRCADAWYEVRRCADVWYEVRRCADVWYEVRRCADAHNKPGAAGFRPNLLSAAMCCTLLFRSCAMRSTTDWNID